MDSKDLNRKFALLGMLIFIITIATIVSRVSGCSRQVETKTVVVDGPPTSAPTEAPPPITDTNDKFLTFDEVEDIALKDLSRPELNDADRLNFRYLTVSDVFDEGKKTDQAALGLQKTLNQVSSERFTKIARPIDPNGTIVRIDLRDYFGSRGRTVWQIVEKNLPVKVVSATIRGKTLQFLTQAVEPVVHGRLFSEGVLTTGYYDIMRVPSTLADFYKNTAGVIPQADFDARDPDLTLAGTQESQIGQNNRLVWRLQGKDGPVYQTFDVDDNNIGAAQNLFENPFPAEANPLGKPVTARIFKHAASEIIWTNPNGTFGFALFNAAGVRQNAAPQTVVTNSRAVALGLSSEIRNARDCTGCHAGGFLPMKEDIGQHIQKSSLFNAVEKQLGQLFFRPQATFDAFIAQDNGQYMKALDSIQVKSGPDPINIGLLDDVRTGMNAKEVASFFFLDEADFVEQLKGVQAAQAELGALTRGGTISFQQFVNSAPQIISDLNLFIDVE